MKSNNYKNKPSQQPIDSSKVQKSKENYSQSLNKTRDDYNARHESFHASSSKDYRTYTNQQEYVKKKGTAKQDFRKSDSAINAQRTVSYERQKRLNYRKNLMRKQHREFAKEEHAKEIEQRRQYEERRLEENRKIEERRAQEERRRQDYLQELENQKYIPTQSPLSAAIQRELVDTPANRVVDLTERKEKYEKLNKRKTSNENFSPKEKESSSSSQPKSSADQNFYEADRSTVRQHHDSVIDPKKEKLRKRQANAVYKRYQSDMTENTGEIKHQDSSTQAQKFKMTDKMDLDGDGIIDRYDADFRDSKVQHFDDLDEREDARADSEKEYTNKDVKDSLIFNSETDDLSSPSKKKKLIKKAYSSKHRDEQEKEPDSEKEYTNKDVKDSLIFNSEIDNSSSPSKKKKLIKKAYSSKYRIEQEKESDLKKEIRFSDKMLFDDEEKLGADHLKLDQKLESVSERIARLNKDKNVGAATVERSVSMSALALKAAKKRKQYASRLKNDESSMIHEVKEHKFNIEDEAIRRTDQLNVDKNIAVESGTKAAKATSRVRKSTQKVNRAYQKARNKKKAREAYLESKGASKSSQPLRERISNALKNPGQAIKKVGEKAGAKYLALALVIVLLIFMLFSCVSSSLVGINYLGNTSYLADFIDVTEADKYYMKQEAELQWEIQNIKKVYPGFDEYIVADDAIGHDPHLLIAYLTVKFEDFKLKDVKRELDSIFKEQYQYNVVKRTEIRYRQNGTPYVYRILEATLYTNDLETVLRSRLGGEDYSGATGEIGDFGNGQFAQPLKSLTITSRYGPRKAPVPGASTFHRGVDFSAKIGTPVYASESGRVVINKYNSARGWYIVIDHGGGLRTLYQHLNGRAPKAVGSTVQRGEVIAHSGNSGIGSAAHLHYEVQVNGKPVNPLPYIQGHGRRKPKPNPPAPEPRPVPDTSTGKDSSEKNTDLERFDIYMESKGNFMFFESPIEGDWKGKVSRMFGWNVINNKVTLYNWLDIDASGEKVVAVNDGIVSSNSDGLTLTDDTGWKIKYRGVSLSKAGKVKIGDQIGTASGKLSIQIINDQNQILNPYFHLWSESGRIQYKMYNPRPSIGSIDFASGGWGQGGAMPSEAKPFDDYFIATAYTPDPKENGGYNGTAMGTKLVRGVVAVDPKVIPLGTVLWVEGYGVCRAEDTGGAIKGKRLDLLFETKKEAYNWGRRKVRVAILPKGYKPGGNVSERRTSILKEAQRYSGVPYVWGGTSPRGFDCSGFVHYVYKQKGINIPRETVSLYNGARKVSAEQAKPGDIVFFHRTYNTSKPISHVGIYIGNGKMIHASSSRGVIIADINTKYWRSKLVGFGSYLP
ncbi:NlpC/P60 family protein [Aedoeadaptatus acetigenes]|uniref:NlpC/P60 family protein n=1 Tax=Aedoeadaptatus acetigenes TaxID=2981723 RepID=A0ABV1J869_9FIRM